MQHDVVRQYCGAHHEGTVMKISWTDWIRSSRVQMSSSSQFFAIWQVFGFFLPGFSLVDALLRITGRHAFVNIMLPLIIENIGDARLGVDYFGKFHG